MIAIKVPKRTEKIFSFVFPIFLAFAKAAIQRHVLLNIQNIHTAYAHRSSPNAPIVAAAGQTKPPTNPNILHFLPNLSTVSPHAPT